MQSREMLQENLDVSYCSAFHRPWAMMILFEEQRDAVRSRPDTEFLRELCLQRAD